ncbi:hypothetical protein GFL21_15210 [Rhizobium anhuiense]|uniref:hypothetical protein n=1 Tax=Rhizobium anhuiense TaxID=1184720 RepID=UPI00197EC4E6|nr:hypothetical protein [Rhizobium anhuiense]NKM55859.1 hypothetical protein [Rhizobium anhuiense]
MAEVLPMERPTIRDALELFHRLIVDLQAAAQRELDLGANGYSPEEASARLANIVPLQKVAPVQFQIDQDRLKVEHHYSKSHPADQNNVTAARDALLDQGNRILESLRTSNCDPRLLDALKQLHSNLHDMQDVVRLGIQNIACEELRLGFEPELPTALAALIKGHTTAIGLYVAQFPEWQQFADNAARVELNPDDIRQLRNTAYDLVAELEEDDRVDIEVPASIKFLADAVKDPAHASKRTSFALLRSLENLIAKIFRYAADLVSETAGEIKKTVSKTVAGVVGRFVGIVLAGAMAVLPVYGKFADTAWMKSAAPLVQSLLSNSPK